uniref:Uncharacterized protein n=1 Tax=Papio anubis TaxID=9555 RepID=A0A8I5NG82_PAPAN
MKLILHPVLFPCWQGVVILWRRRGILVFGIFCLFALVFPHLRGFIYLWPLRLVTFGWGFGMGILFVDVDAVAFCLLVFLLTVRSLFFRSARVCWRSTPGPVCLDITSRGCRTANIAACSLLWKLHPREAPTRCQPELFCMRYLLTPAGMCLPVRSHRCQDPFEEAIGPLAELKGCAGRSAALFRANRQEHLRLLKLRPQLSLPPRALSQGDRNFIYKPLTGAAAFLSEMPCPERRNLERQCGYSSFAALWWVGSASVQTPSGFVYTVRGKPPTQASVMADAPFPSKLMCPRSTSDCCAGSENFKPVDLSLLGSMGVGSAEQDQSAPLLQPPFQGSERFYQGNQSPIFQHKLFSIFPKCWLV